MNLSDIVTNNAKERPWSIALIDTETDEKFTYSELDVIINRVGNALKEMGVTKGDRVALYLPNSKEFIMTHYALARIGAISVPFNVIYKSREIEYILNNAKPKVLFGAAKEVEANVVPLLAGSPFLEKIITLGESNVPGAINFASIIANGKDKLDTLNLEPTDTVSILYTSGTTGNPKGAMLTHSNYIKNAFLMGNDVLTINDEDIFYTHTPYPHIFYVFCVLGAMSAGAALVVSPRFVTENALNNISKYKVTHYAGVPTMYIFMLNEFTAEKYDVSSLRFAQAAGASMPEEHIQKIEDTFGVNYIECYGSTESSTTVTYTRVGHKRIGSVGRVAPGWECKLIDENDQDILAADEVGELCIKGQGLFKGYWDMPEATEKAFIGDGWFKTGDMCRRDEDGFYFIVDRKNDLLLVGGYNVYPREIEEVLYTNPKILEAVVIGVKDLARGELPKAYVTLKEGVSAEGTEFVAYCKERMAGYKVPTSVEIVPELPKNPTGKILKRIIRDEWNK